MNGKRVLMISKMLSALLNHLSSPFSINSANYNNPKEVS